MAMIKKYLLSVLVFFPFLLYAQNFADYASTPPMGWNSWDCYGPTVTEKEVKTNADYMAENLKQFGWKYIVVDIRWYVENPKTHGYNEKDPVFQWINTAGSFLLLTGFLLPQTGKVLNLWRITYTVKD